MREKWFKITICNCNIVILVVSIYYYNCNHINLFCNFGNDRILSLFKKTTETFSNPHELPTSLTPPFFPYIPHSL